MSLTLPEESRIRPYRGPARRGIVDRSKQTRESRAVLDRLGQQRIPTNARVRDLPLAARQMTEIAKAVAHRVRLLIMDEPTAILAQEETNALFAVIEQLRAAAVAKFLAFASDG